MSRKNKNVAVAPYSFARARRGYSTCEVDAYLAQQAKNTEKQTELFRATLCDKDAEINALREKLVAHDTQTEGLAAAFLSVAEKAKAQEAALIDRWRRENERITAFQLKWTEYAQKACKDVVTATQQTALLEGYFTAARVEIKRVLQDVFGIRFPDGATEIEDSFIDETRRLGAHDFFKKE